MSTPIDRPGIVVGVDGSSSSKAAIDWAARDAALRNVSLTLVHVASGLGQAWPQTPPLVGLGEWQQRHCREILADAVRIAENAAREAHAIPIKTETYYSAIIPTLVDMSKGADMVVVGCRGAGAFGPLLGSVSSGLANHAHCPVAVIHDDVPPPAPPPAPGHVLVGIDGSPVSELATAIAFDEASRRHVNLIALHAWSDTALEFPDIDWAMIEASEDEVLAERLAGWQERYPDVMVHRDVVCDRPARQLVERSEAAQLVVVGSHGRGGYAGMLLGSVSSAVVQSVRAPVIVARAQ